MNRRSLKTERKILRLLHGLKTGDQLPQIHAHVLRHNLHQSNQILSHFVSICGTHKKVNYATQIFNQAHNPNIFLFNSMIKACSLSGPFEESLRSFSLMKDRGIWPDEYTFAPLLKACSSLSSSETRVGECVQGEVIRGGYERFGSIRIGVVELYSTFGKMGDAMKVFDEMGQREVIVWNLLIRGFCKRGDVDMGLNIFRQMSERSIVSWNSMISFLAQSRRDGEALELFNAMRGERFELDEATIVTLLPVCSRLRAIDIGQWVHSYSESKGLVRNFISVGNAIVDFYCKCGMLEAARDVFIEMPRKNVVSWNAIISGLAFNGKGQLGVDLFEEMMTKDVTPNESTFVSVLTCCAHVGMVEKGRELFDSMVKRHCLEPSLEHYGCMVDVLGRSGCVREAYDLIRSMSMTISPSAALWGSLLSACRTYGDVELAEVAVKELINLEPWNSGNYVLLSNIYAEEGRWDDVEKMRVLMREKSVKKWAGQSAIG